MGKKAWWSWPFEEQKVKDFIFGKDPEIQTKTVEDPYKMAVTNPLSKFLASSIGKGLPKYEGGTPSLGEDYENRYSEFVGMSPTDWFQSSIAAPTMKEWGKETVPIIEEGWAGNLRGSGRFRDVEESAFKMGEDISRVGGELVPSLYTSQLAAGTQRFGSEMQKWAADYASWLQTLPEFNPVLDKALAFLAGPSGRDVIAATDPGKEGIVSDLIKMAATAAAVTAMGSDMRLKDDIVYYDVEVIPGVRLASWVWNSDALKVLGLKGKGVGVIAQDVEKVLPQAVSVMEDGYMRVDYNKVFGGKPWQS